MASRKHHEDDEAKALWQWAQHIPELRECLYHIPNGGNRNAREAGRMKAQGVRAGVHDYHLPIARGGFIGLWIELKATPPNNAPVSKSQKEWGQKMLDQGHAVFFCKGWLVAKRVFDWYLSLPESSLTESCPSLKEVVNLN